MHFYVDYLAECAPPSAPPFFFRANHSLCERTLPQRRHASETYMKNDLIDYDSRNLSNEYNYVWADIDGFEGNYVGTVLAVESHLTDTGNGMKATTCFSLMEGHGRQRFTGRGRKIILGWRGAFIADTKDGILV